MNSQGFSVILIPIFLLIFGAFINLTVTETKPKTFYNEVETQSKMERVQKALAAYSHRNYRIPCPADPSLSGAALGMEAVAGNNPGDNCTRREGIIPFRELGLAQADIKDAWGNYITYTTTPSFTKIVNGAFSPIDESEILGGDAGSMDDNILVPVGGAAAGTYFAHQMCRTDQWLRQEASYIAPDGNSISFASGNESINGNMFKAQFCCAASINSTPGSQFIASDYIDELDKRDGTNPSSLTHDGMTFSIEPFCGVAESRANCSDSSEPRQLAYWGNGQNYRDYVEAIPHNDGVNEGEGLGGYSFAHDGDKIFLENLIVDFDAATNPSELTVQMKDVAANKSNNNVPLSYKFTIGTDEYSFIGPQNIGPALNFTATFTINIDELKQRPEFISQMEGQGLTAVDFSSLKLEQFKFHANIPPEYEAAGLDTNRISRLSLVLSEFGYQAANTNDGGDLLVRNEANNDILPDRFSNGNPDDYQAVNELSSVPANSIDNFEATAYALISHGENAEGAYLVNGSAARIDNISSANESAAERENFNYDPSNDTSNESRQIKSQRKVLSGGADHFDDVVLWDSQFTLYNALSNGTCETSQAL